MLQISAGQRWQIAWKWEIAWKTWEARAVRRGADYRTSVRMAVELPTIRQKSSVDRLPLLKACATSVTLKNMVRDESEF
jgi:hypothetical protein